MPAQPPRPQRQPEPLWAYLVAGFGILCMLYFIGWALLGAALGVKELALWIGSFSAAQILHGFLIGVGFVMCWLVPFMIVCPHVFYC